MNECLTFLSPALCSRLWGSQEGAAGAPALQELGMGGIETGGAERRSRPRDTRRVGGRRLGECTRACTRTHRHTHTQTNIWDKNKMQRPRPRNVVIPP